MTPAVVAHTAGFVSLSGRPAPPGFLAEALARGQSFARIDREVAAALGLPRRAAMVGLASFHDAAGATYRVAAVATAAGPRSRIQAGRRVLLSVLVAAGGAALGGAGPALAATRAGDAEAAGPGRSASPPRGRSGERASRAATLGTLAMGITHELSTPLSIIAARAEQLIKPPARRRAQRAGAQVIAEQAERMGQIIRGILALVRDQPPIADRLSPLSVGKGAVALVRHRFDEVGVDLPHQRRCWGWHFVAARRSAAVRTGRGQPAAQRLRCLSRRWSGRPADCLDGWTGSSPGVGRWGRDFSRSGGAGDGAVLHHQAGRAGLGPGPGRHARIVKSHRGTLRIEPRKGRYLRRIALPQAEEGHAHAT